MYRNFKTVPYTIFGRGCFNQLKDILSAKRPDQNASMIFLMDDVFRGGDLKNRLPLQFHDLLIWVNVDDEPKTEYVDQLTDQIKAHTHTTPLKLPVGVIGIGGGSTLDLAKAVSLMLTNPGSAADYQGWDRIRHPAVYHVGIPTLSGTGAEISRTTVLTGPTKKLGINSDHTVFDQIVLDPELIAGAPATQRFYTGMDCYIHCVESLTGTYLNTFSQSYGEKARELCLEVFMEDSPDANDKLMMASYLGGMSIAYSQVGICHAMSYGLCFVTGLHHGIGNCIVFNHLEEFYPEGVLEFRKMKAKHRIDLPSKLVTDLPPDKLDTMVDVALVMEPLWENAFGSRWKKIMPRNRVKALYLRM